MPVELRAKIDMVQRIDAGNVARLRRLGALQFGWISQLRWSPRGDMLAIAGGDGIAIYIGGFGGAPTFRLTGHSAPVKAIAFSPGGDRLASGSADTTIRVWSIAAADVVGSSTLLGHSGSVDALAWRADGAGWRAAAATAAFDFGTRKQVSR